MLGLDVSGLLLVTIRWASLDSVLLGPLWALREDELHARLRSWKRLLSASERLLRVNISWGLALLGLGLLRAHQSKHSAFEAAEIFKINEYAVLRGRLCVEGGILG